MSNNSPVLLSDKLTSKVLTQLEKNIVEMYGKAADEMRATSAAYFNNLKDRVAEEYKAYLDGKYTKDEFIAWYQTQVQRGNGYKEMTAKLAARAAEADKVAEAYINDATPTIFSLNANYEAYRIDQAYNNVDFQLYDEQTVRRLMGQANHIEFRTVSVDPLRDYYWNREQIHKALTAGILQGKSVEDLAQSFLQVMGRDVASARRNARTAVTSAQNAGREETYYRAAQMGIELKKEWISTLDGRTRDSHADIDGERVPYDKPFSNGLMHPADVKGAPAEVYNCRCTMRAIIPDVNDEKRITYKDWFKKQEKKRGKERDKNKKTITGNDILGITENTVPTLDNNSGIMSNYKPNYTTSLAKELGADFYDEVNVRVVNCGNADLTKVWKHYENQIKVESVTSGDPKTKGNKIRVNKTRDAKGSSYERPYATTVHESAHAIDYVASKTITNRTTHYYSSSYKDGAFPKTIRKEVDALVDRFDKALKAEFKSNKDNAEWLLQNGYVSKINYDMYKKTGKWGLAKPRYSKSRAYRAVEKEINALNPYARADISDILEGATKSKILCGYGHWEEYWDDEDNLSTEAFAEITHAIIINGESLATIQKYLPDTYTLYIEMIKNLAGVI